MYRRLVQSNKGSVSVLAIITMVVLGLLGAGLITLSSQDVKVSANYCDGVAAQFAAEAGVQAALVGLGKSTPERNKSKINVSSDGSYLVTYSYDAPDGTYNGQNVYIVTSIGEVWADSSKTKLLARRKVVATVRKGQDPDCYVGASLSWSGYFYGEAGKPPATIAIANYRVAQIQDMDTYKKTSPTHHDNVTFSNNIITPPPYPYLGARASDYSSNTLLPTGNGGNIESPLELTASAYYYNDAVTIKSSITTASADPVTIYVNGTVNIDSTASLNGNINIVVLRDYGEIKVDTANINTSASSNDKTVKLYAPGTLHINKSVGGNLVAWSRDSELYINGNAKVNGELHSGGDMYVNGEVTGKVIAAKNLTLNGEGKITLKGDYSGGSKNLAILKWANN